MFTIAGSLSDRSAAALGADALGTALEDADLTQEPGGETWNALTAEIQCAK